MEGVKISWAWAPGNNGQSSMLDYKQKKQLPGNLRLLWLLFQETRVWRESELSLENKEPVIQNYSGQLLKKHNL